MVDFWKDEEIDRYRGKDMNSEDKVKRLYDKYGMKTEIGYRVERDIYHMIDGLVSKWKGKVDMMDLMGMFIGEVYKRAREGRERR